MATIAFLSPLPPAKTGIATYANAVLEGLAQIGSGGHRIDGLWPVGPDARSRVLAADTSVYQLGNNIEFHGDIYRLSVTYPGIAVLHDLALDGLMYGLGTVNDPLTRPARVEAMAAARPGADPDDPLGVPWCAQAVRRARGVIVHSRFARDYLVGVGCLTPISVVPHPLVETDEEVEAARGRGAELRAGVVRGEEVLVGIAGDLNASKGISELLAAASIARSDIRVVLVGRTSQHWDVRTALREAGLGDRVTVVTNAPDGDFLGWLCAFDVLVNVRHPHRGEASGSLVRALHVGTPTIVSGAGTYLEVPDDVVARIAPGPPDPSELASAIDALVADPATRKAMGERARRYAHEALAPARTAEGYLEAIDGVLALQADPARAALARWAGGLRELGVAPRHVVRGFGVAYADALAELRSGR